MGVYGNMLSAFPELFRRVEFWTGEPEIGSGYTKAEAEYHNVIILTDKSVGFQTKKIVDYALKDILNRDVMYTTSSTPIAQGMFLIHPDDSDVYRVDVPLDYSYTGGFKAWGIAKVQGSTGEGEVVNINKGYYE